MPHVARLIVADSDHRVLMPAAVLAGAVVMVGCDIVSKAFGIPVNAVTSLLEFNSSMDSLENRERQFSDVVARAGHRFRQAEVALRCRYLFRSLFAYGFTRTQRQRQIHFAEGQWPGLAAMMVLSVSRP